ncbi:hypothetical protein [Sinorhizobium meliloti]|uniref:hypothetical protein n=1 Tax=Rhizobium meliloti TaxID=382 RepID=UPI003D658332
MSILVRFPEYGWKTGDRPGSFTDGSVSVKTRPTPVGWMGSIFPVIWVGHYAILAICCSLQGAAMCDLDGREIVTLQNIITATIPDALALDQFVLGNDLGKAPTTVVSGNSGYDDLVFNYLKNKVVYTDLLSPLLDHLSRTGLSSDRRRKLLSLMDPESVAGDMWFAMYRQDNNFEQGSIQKAGGFKFFENLHPFVSELWTKPTPLQEKQIQWSKYLVAVITQDDLENTDSWDQSTLRFALNNWLKSDDRQRKFAVILQNKEKISAWWDYRTSTLTPSDLIEQRAPFVRTLRVEEEALSTLKDELEEYFSNPPAPPLSSILILGNPELSAPEQAASNSADDNLVYADLFGRNNERVKYWRDGWGAAQRLDGDEREAFVNSSPILVRSSAESQTAIASLKGSMIGPLIRALGHDIDDPNTWANTISKFRKVYWRREGVWLDANDINKLVEKAWLGTPDQIAKQLAQLAGFPEAREQKLRIRFEDLPDSEPKRELLTHHLRVLRGNLLPDVDSDDTVPVMLNILDKSVKNFLKYELNIVAAHDQRAKPGDTNGTIKHFEQWDSIIDRLVDHYFPVNRPKIMRIAVLMQNYHFEGTNFGEYSSVRRWNLLRPNTDGPYIGFDQRDLENLQNVASDMLTH